MTADPREAQTLPGGIAHVVESPGLSRSYYHAFIGDFMRELHSHIPPMAAPDLQKPPCIENRQDFFHGESVQRTVVFLLSNGCEWALRSANGCTMCGHLAKQIRTASPLPPEYFVSQFAAALRGLDFTDTPVLNIYNNGSFFNDNEIPAEARRAILTMVSRIPQIKKLLVECRPEFVNEAAIREARDILGDKELEIAVGLETSDDFRRIVCINKGFTLNEFVRAARIIKDNGVDLKTYILVKPPFCSEGEAIEDAVASIETAFRLGADRVSLEGMTIQKYTLIDYLTTNGRYSLPWLWSLVEIVKRTAHLGNVAVSMFRFYPSPESVPGNCPKCNDRVLEALRTYNETLDVEPLRELTCECRDRWAKACSDRRDSREQLNDFVEAITTGTSPAPASGQA